MAYTTHMFNSMKLKLWFRRLSISSPRVAIKTRLSWPMRLLSYVAVIGIGGAVALWTYDMGRNFTTSPENDVRAQLAYYQERVEKLTSERDRYSATANSAESQLTIERSAQQQLAAQVKTLEAENIRLEEDLAFFESLLPTATGPQGISIRRLKIDQIAPGQLRYRLLIMQGGRGTRPFQGMVQLQVAVEQGGNSAMITFPEENSTEPGKFKLGFKHYQRLEGVVTLPEGAVAKSVQARVMEQGQVRVQQSVNL